MRRIHIPSSVKHRYRLFPPSGHNRRFRVMRLEAKWVGIRTPEIDSINERFMSAKITAAAAREQLDLVIEALYRADGVKVSRVESNGPNEQIAQSYIAEKIAKKKKLSLSSKAAAVNYVNAAVRALGEHSLATADVDTLQSTLDAEYPDQRQRRLVTVLNSILHWLKRDVRLEPHAYIPPDVKHIPEEKFRAILENLPSEAWRVLAELAFYSGLRIGELFALETHHKKQFVIAVDWQITRDGKKTLPKNGKRRTAAAFLRAFHVFNRWIELKHEITMEERRFASRTVRKACQATYPNRVEWHLRFHDLRHSYAVHALDRGMSIEMIAKQLGNAIEVCERHYIGFVQSSKMEEVAFEMLNGKAS